MENINYIGEYWNDELKETAKQFVAFLKQIGISVWMPAGLTVKMHPNTCLICPDIRNSDCPYLIVKVDKTIYFMRMTKNVTGSRSDLLGGIYMSFCRMMEKRPSLFGCIDNFGDVCQELSELMEGQNLFMYTHDTGIDDIRFREFFTLPKKDFDYYAKLDEYRQGIFYDKFKEFYPPEDRIFGYADEVKSCLSNEMFEALIGD